MKCSHFASSDVGDPLLAIILDPQYHAPNAVGRSDNGALMSWSDRSRAMLERRCHAACHRHIRNVIVRLTATVVSAIRPSLLISRMRQFLHAKLHARFAPTPALLAAGGLRASVAPCRTGSIKHRLRRDALPEKSAHRRYFVRLTNLASAGRLDIYGGGAGSLTPKPKTLRPKLDLDKLDFLFSSLFSDLRSSFTSVSQVCRQSIRSFDISVAHTQQSSFAPAHA